ncbi:hypothetical protein K491DRAFT_99449 [Lophiostoma macrostomum CBS 122681]|uniref:Uncharacterized protein n=1 Tax=Lophiostoma macrostomum CBS 122681 TaxID=1314788 RepID=A0A6A6SUB2_9PLEO|nr:hypothetical protein K491DRAFT_99449 [Lophiostoma macrostomum CBS 122681]
MICTTYLRIAHCGGVAMVDMLCWDTVLLIPFILLRLSASCSALPFYGHSGRVSGESHSLGSHRGSHSSRSHSSRSHSGGSHNERSYNDKSHSSRSHSSRSHSSRSHSSRSHSSRSHSGIYASPALSAFFSLCTLQQFLLFRTNFYSARPNVTSIHNLSSLFEGK